MRASIAIILVLLGLAGASTASTAASPVPALVQTRIAAEYGPAFAFLPSSAPPGFRLHSWTVDGGSFGFLLDRLRLRFRKGTSDLIWEVASGHPDETADRATCERSRPSRVIRGRRVYDVGDDTAYVCIRAAGQYGSPLLAVSVREVTPSDLDMSDLRRMVAGATSPRLDPSIRATALVPVGDARALRASFDGPVPLPRTMARGFIFTRAYVEERSRYFPRTVTVLFGRLGRRLMWTVAPTGHGPDIRCTRADRYRPTVVSGRKVYWLGGAKGQSAWTCVTQPKRVTVELWNDYSVSKSGLKRIVASARW